MRAVYFCFSFCTLEIPIRWFSSASKTIQVCIKDNSGLKTIQVWRQFNFEEISFQDISFEEISFEDIFFEDIFSKKMWRDSFAKRFFCKEILLQRDSFAKRFFCKEIPCNEFLDNFLQVDQGVIWRTMMDWESLAAVAEKVDEGQIPTTKQTVYVRQRSSIVFYQAKQDWKLIALHDFAKKETMWTSDHFFVNLYLSELK